MAIKEVHRATIDDSVISEVVVGRVEPHIYTFKTNTLPNLLKVGDSYRPVEERLNEWRRYYKNLSEVSRHKALVNSNIFFRDHSVHKFLESIGKTRVSIDRNKNIYSNEFFRYVNRGDVAKAVEDITKSYGIPGKYTYYDSLKDKVEMHYTRDNSFKPRGNQREVISNFISAVARGRTNLLMYAVMRFGKSVTSLWCAKKVNSKLTIVVSAKADVRSEWKQAVESHKDFTGYRFMDSSDLKSNISFDQIYDNEFFTGDGKTEICTNVVLFLTLQDLAGSAGMLKKHHEVLQNIKPDLLIIDETHFGARAQVLGKILAGVELSEEDNASLKVTDGIDDLGTIKGLKPINAKIKIHLSGTPYRILMGSEFAKEDIIAFVQFSDIYESKMQWSANNLDNNDTNEWDNPYYGFPQMVRFAFNPNESSRAKLKSIPGSKPAEIFAPIENSKNGNYETFVHEKEVTELLQVLDGTKKDTQLLGLLDHQSIKAGKLTRHLVIVLPFKASCDAFEKLVHKRSNIFRNLSEYKILNISGHNASLKKPDQIKSAIASAEENNEKTITLTVNKMLTGSTVPQWDTMIFLKATVSPQEYDQAIFRLQSPWIKNYTSDNGEVIKYDMKPQTLLVDLDPTRLFFLQEAKALSYGANTAAIGNENIKQFMARELKVSPVLAINAENNKLVEIKASVIIDAVRRYASERSISEDVNEIGVDISLRDNGDIYGLISSLSEINSNNGLRIKPIEGEGDELETENGGLIDTGEQDDSALGSSSNTTSDKDITAIRSFEKQFRMYYVLILLFAFLSATEEKSLADVIANIHINEDNRRIARSLGLKKEDLVALRKSINFAILSSLDYKIQNSDFRANDDTISPVEHINIAINKFGKLSESEVFTPSHVVDMVYDSFDDNFWTDVASAKVLDIASKSGSFANGFVNRALQHGISLLAIKDSFYSIPTSPAAYEFTHKMYEALGLNIENIAQRFNSYDILELKHPNAITSLLQGNKLSEITKKDLRAMSDIIESNGSEVNQMKFDAVVGNPPYQENIEGRGDQPPIYHLFIDSAYKMSDLVSMIHPARFLFNAGATPKSWNKKMLNDPYLKVEFYEQDSSVVFPNTDIKGGICITVRDTKRITGGLGGSFIHMPQLSSILQKIKKNSKTSLAELFYSNTSYKYSKLLYLENPELRERVSGGSVRYFSSSVFDKFTEILYDNMPKDGDEYIQILGRKNNSRVYKYVKSKYVAEHQNLTKYKVLIPASNGSGEFGEKLSNPLVCGPGIGHTETFVSFGSFGNEFEAQSLLKYIKTKFARTMLGVLKITQSNKSKYVWSNVPLEDFTKKSDINWAESISGIDKQLYKKYDLSKEEIEFIESHVKPME